MSTASYFVKVDDRSPQVQYNGDWVLGGSTSEYSQTTHGASSGGAVASFSFTGNFVAVYGTISNPNDILSLRTRYDIDGDLLSETFSPSAGVERVQYQTLFYKSPPLPIGAHTLSITTLDSNGSFWLDYFIIGSGQPPEANLSASLQSGITSTDLSIPSSAVQSPVPSQRPKPTIPMGVIAGTIVGIIIVIVLIGLAIWLYFRKQKIQNVSYNKDYVSAYKPSSRLWER